MPEENAAWENRLQRIIKRLNQTGGQKYKGEERKNWREFQTTGVKANSMTIKLTQKNLE